MDEDLNWDDYPNFSREEFECPCGCGRADMTHEFMVAIQSFREEVDAPMVITSGFRCEEHNKKVGGAPGSAHVKGQGADWAKPNAPSDKLDELHLKYFSGRGKRFHGTNQYMHGDVMTRRASWTYA